MEDLNEAFFAKLKTKFGAAVAGYSEFRGELTVIFPKERIVEVCAFLKNGIEPRYDLLADLFGLDMNTDEKRFGVVYNCYSTSSGHRVRIKIFTEESDMKVLTVTGIWQTANWHERETYDMFGIVFEGHPDLRRLYMPEEFEYHPLRKDFPLMGIPGSLDLPSKYEKYGTDNRTEQP
jgi:NADH-quinone oxidoreductase subunit C